MLVEIDDLAEVVAEELRNYSQEVADDLKDSVEEAADACVKELRRTSPKDTGDYRKGWRKSTVHESHDDIRIEVHNATDYQLTHLLENPHAKVSGGMTQAQPHIGPAADNAARLLDKTVKVKVGKR